MAQDQDLKKRPEWQRSLGRLFAFNIRGKIILPYLILTLIVAIVGTYIVTSLVASSLDERLTNHLLEAGRVVSDSLARQELDHLETARAVAFTTGLAEALQAGDRDSVAALAQPAAIVRGVECLVIVDAHGQEMLHVLQQDDGSFETIEGQLDTSDLWIIQTLLADGDPNGLPKRSMGQHLVNQRHYYFTAIPVPLENKMVGVVVVGTSLDTLLPYFKLTSLADVTIYRDDGQAIASTFGVAAPLAELSISPELYQSILYKTDVTLGENIRISGRWYRLARAPLRVGNDSLGVFAVALHSHFIVQAGATSRNTYILIFGTATACVIFVGYLISQRITTPISRLVHASRAVANGHLDQRTGIVSTDEIGTLAATFDEMTERLEERTYELEEALVRMRSILSSIGDGVMLEDQAGSLIPLNAAAETMLSEMASGLLLGPLRELPVDYDEITDLQLSPWLLERRCFEAGKKVIHAYSAAVQTDDGENLGTVIVLRDVTAEVEAEHLKDAFVTHVSHELRTPLTAIKGYSELLLTDAGDTLSEAQRSFLGTISRNTDNLVAMINTLLDFSEMEAKGRLGVLQHPVLLSTLVKEVAEEWRPQMEDKGLTFQVEAPADLPLVNADTRRLRWALINLVRNAWQYTPAGGSVTLHLSAQDSQVVLDVVDTGAGISPENQQQIFNRFHNISQTWHDPEPDDEVRGLGLGLYVAKAIVEAHGGEIRVASAEGSGSTFSVILPALPGHEET